MAGGIGDGDGLVLELQGHGGFKRGVVGKYLLTQAECQCVLMVGGDIQHVLEAMP